MMDKSDQNLWLATAETAKEAFAVPSGQAVTLEDIFWDEGDTLVLRVRFLAPQIARAGGTIDYETATKDMQHLCDTYIVPQIEASVDKPDQVIMSLSDIAVPFGEANPEATQFFEAYSLQNGACIWEVY